MKMTRDPNNPDLTIGACDRCETEIHRYRGQGDLQCPKCDANYNCFGQRLRDDLRTRINESEYDDDIDDLTGDELSYLRQEAYDD
jgi:hypothetical protein